MKVDQDWSQSNLLLILLLLCKCIELVFLFVEVKLKTINDFLFSAQMDNVNLFKVKIMKTMLVSRNEHDVWVLHGVSPLMSIYSFLDQKILWEEHDF